MSRDVPQRYSTRNESILPKITETRFSRACKTIALVFLMVVTLSANAATETRWKEEIVLHDGQKIIVKRSQSYRGRSEPGQSAPIGEHSISFQVPGSTRPIVWTSEYSEDLGRTNFNLLAIHILNGTPYIVASPNLCLSYNKWGRPNPPYVVFRYDNAQWQRIALEALPIEFKTINVVLSIQKFQADELSGMGLVSADKVLELNRHVERPEFKGILREPLAKATIEDMCEVRVLYNGFWILPNDPVARKFIDSRKK